MAGSPRSDSDSDPEKPSVLIVGGLGYIGRFLAKYIHDNQLASRVRLVDKKLPSMAQLAPEFLEACSPSICKQGDPTKRVDEIFEHPDGKTWDYVFNVAGTNEWAQTDTVYEQHGKASLALAAAAAKRGVKAYVEASTGTVYESDREPRSETDKIKPWQRLGDMMLKVEQKISEEKNLNLVILRMAHVYGPYLTGMVAKPLILGRIYQYTGEKLEWLWSSDLKMNTVHVEDVARALWTAAEWRIKNPVLTMPTGRLPSSNPDVGPRAGTPVFNLVDHGATSQGSMAKLASDHFDVRTGFANPLIAQFARFNMGFVIDKLNKRHLKVWAKMCELEGINPLPPGGPFLETELVKDEDLSLDGSLFERTTGFKYEYESLTVDRVNEMIDSWKSMHWWP